MMLSLLFSTALVLGQADSIQFRPEFGYYRNWNTPTFDNGQRKDMFMAAFDFTIRF
jgi:hypothetical protein